MSQKSIFKRPLWFAILLASIVCATHGEQAHAQLLVQCNTTTGSNCNTTSNPGNGTQGDPAWLSFGKGNANFLFLSPLWQLPANSLAGNSSGTAGSIGPITAGANITISNGVISAASTAATSFGSLTSAQNNQAAMGCGTGCSLFTVGSGSIAASTAPVTGITGLGANMVTFLENPSSFNLFSAMTTRTGAGNVVFGTGPTITGLTLGDITGANQCLHASSIGIVTGTGSDCGGVSLTASGSNIVLSPSTITNSGTIGFTAAPTFTTVNGITPSNWLVSGGALGTPSSGIATNLTGTAAGLSIGGNAATATALGAIPSQCSGSQFATGITATGSANCATPTGNVSNSGTPAQYQTPVWASPTSILGIGPGTAGQALVSGGASAYPSYSSSMAGVTSVNGTSIPAAASLLTNGGALGTPSSGTATNLTGLPTSGLTGTLLAAQEPAHTGDVTNTAGFLALTVKGINGTTLSGLATGILKNTTGTGVPSIAVVADFPTLNQNTTGSAASLSGSLTNCSGGQFALGITSTGAANCGTPAGSGNMSTSGTPAQHQVGVFASGTTMGGVAPSATAGEAFVSNGASADPGYSTSLPGVTSVNGTSIPSSATLLTSGGALGTPSSGVATNLTGTAAALNIGGNAATATTASAAPVSGLTGLGSGMATFLATPSSANLAATVTNETGTGLLVFGTGPTITLANATGLPLTTGVTGLLPFANMNLTSANVLGLWTGSCTSSTYLRGDGACAAPAGSGSVTSVAATVPSFLSVTGSPITSAGTLAISYSGTALPVANGGTGATTLTGPIKGNGTAAFTASTAADIVGLFSTCSGSQYLGADGACHNASGAGTVTSVAATVPAFLSVTGSPVTTSGTLALSYSGTALPIANGGTGATAATGTGNAVLATSPTLVTPALGTPSALVCTNCSGTAAALNIGGNAATATTASAAPVSGITGFGANVEAFLATPSSANLAAAITDETGTGANVFAGSPVLVTPSIKGSSTGTTTIASANASTTSYTATLPAATDTIVELTQAQTLTNKTLTAPAISNPTITGGGAFGTPASLVGTNITGTAASLNVGGTASNLSGTPALPNGTTATTQTTGDNTTKLATTAFVLANASASGVSSAAAGGGIVITGTGGGPYTGAITIGTTVPNRTVTASPTVAAGDMGGVLITNVSGGGTVTIPAISSTVFASGMSSTIINYSASTAAISTTPTVNAGGGCVSGTGIPSGDTWEIVSNGTTLDCNQTISAGGGGGSGTVNSGTSGYVAYYASAGTAVSAEQYLTAGQMPALTGDVTNSAGSLATTVVKVNGAAVPASAAVLASNSSNQLVAASSVSYLIDGGTTFTLSGGTGACATTSTLLGGTASGRFTCTGTSGTMAITVVLPTATHGWDCHADDKTTPADTIVSGADTTTGFSFSGTVVSGDVIRFMCMGS